MSRVAVARTYAEALLELAAREGAEEAYGERLAEVAGVFREEAGFRRFVETPRVPLAEKGAALRAAFGDRLPVPFLRFLLVALDKRRLGLLPEIEAAYRERLDRRLGRVRAAVTLTVEPDAELREEVRRVLARVLEREVVPTFRRDGTILGGVVVRVEDRLLDASLRRRLQQMRRILLQEGAPAGAA